MGLPRNSYPFLGSKGKWTPTQISWVVFPMKVKLTMNGQTLFFPIKSRAQSGALPLLSHLQEI